LVVEAAFVLLFCVVPVMSCIHYKFKSSLDYKTVSFEGLSVTLTNLKRLILEKEGIRTADFDLKVSNAQTGKEYTEDGGPIMRHTSVVVARVPADAQRRLPKVWDRSTEGVVVSSSSSIDSVGFSSLLVRFAFYEFAIGAFLQFAFINLQKTGKNMTEEERIKLMEKESTREYDPSKYCKKNVTLTGTPPPSYLCNRCGQTGHWIKFCPTLNVKRTTGIPKNELLETTPDDPQAMMTSIGTFAVPVLHKNAFLIGKKEKPFISEEDDESLRKPAEASEKEALPTELLCSLCDNILKDAVVIPCCGFSFCDQCIRKHLLGKQECPNCREPAVAAASLIPNGQLRMAVLKYRREKDCQNKPAAVHIPMAATMKCPQSLASTSNAAVCKNVAKNSITAVQAGGGGAGAFSSSKQENLLSSKAVKPTVGARGGGVEQKMNPNVVGSSTKLTNMVPRCITNHNYNSTNATTVLVNNNSTAKSNPKNTGVPLTTVTSAAMKCSALTATAPAAAFLGVASSNANNAAGVGGGNGNNVVGGNGGAGAGAGGGTVMTTKAAVLRANSPNAPVFPPTIPPYMPQPYYAGFQGLASYPVSIPPPVLPVAMPVRPFGTPFPSQPPPPGLYSAGQIDPFSAHFPPANVRPLVDEKPFCMEKSHPLPNRNYRDRDAWDDYLALKDRLRPSRRTSSDSSRSPRRRRRRSSNFFCFVFNRSSHRHSSYRKSSRDRYREISKSHSSRRSSSTRHRHDSSRGRRVTAVVEEKRTRERRKYENDHRHQKSDQRRDAKDDGSKGSKKKNVDVMKEVVREASLKPTNMNNQDENESNVNKSQQSVVKTTDGERSKSIPAVNRQDTKRSTAKVATASTNTSTSAAVDGKVEATDKRHYSSSSKRSSKHHHHHHHHHQQQQQQQQQQHRVKRKLSSSTAEGKENLDVHSNLKRKPTPSKSGGSKRRSPATTTTTVAGARNKDDDNDVLVSERLDFCELTEIDVYTLSECEKSATEPTPGSEKTNNIQQQPEQQQQHQEQQEQPKNNNQKATTITTTTVELKARNSNGCQQQKQQQQQQQQQRQTEKKRNHGQPPAVGGDSRGRSVAEKTHDKKLHRDCNNNGKEEKRDEHRPKKGGGDIVMEKRNRDERPKVSSLNVVAEELPAADDDTASAIVADVNDADGVGDSGGGGGAAAGADAAEVDGNEEGKEQPEKQETAKVSHHQQEQPNDQEKQNEDQDGGKSLNSDSAENKKEKKRKKQKRKKKKKDRKEATSAASSSGKSKKKKKHHRRRRRRQHSRHRRHHRRHNHHRADGSRDQSSSSPPPPRPESKRHHRKKRSKRADDHTSDTAAGGGGGADNGELVVDKKKAVKYSKSTYASSSSNNNNNNNNNNSKHRYAQYNNSGNNHEDLHSRMERRWDASEEEGRTSSRHKSDGRHRRHRYH
ncbi:E3 ubiquitin-protein ligase RBBP6, partial [Trichinella pseudospiralis]